jgi:hypothetical protein
MGTLLEGDSDNDNDVDGMDASIVNLAFGSAPASANWDPRADFNEDDVVNGVDMGLLAASFGLSGDVEVGPSAAGAASGAQHESRVMRHASAPSVTIGFSPASVSKTVGDIFTVNVVIHAGAQPVDTVDAYISFPYGALRVVTAGGSPATEIESGSAFGMELINTADNATGLIHYAATMLGGSLTGDITVATIRFKAINPAAGEWVRFRVWPPEETDVTYRGESVLADWPAAAVTVTGRAKVYLPIGMKQAPK